MGRRAKGEAPRVRVDRSSGCGRVIIGGRTIWLGGCPDGKPTAEQEAKAARLWLEHLSGHAPAPAPRKAPPAAAATEPQASQHTGLTVAALGLKYLDHAEAYYRGADGRHTSSVDGARMAVRALLPFADLPAAAFSPKDMTVLRDAAVREGRPRVTINAVLGGVRRIFKWALGEGLVPAASWLSLTAVPPLKRGRTDAPECPPVEEVPEAIVEATLPHLPPIVRAMVQLQRWTGARPAEICLARPCDIDRSGDVWILAPHHHKLAWRDDARPRRITIGSEGQRALLPYLLRAADAYCFSPKEAEAARARARRAERKSPLTPSQRARRPKKGGKRRPGDRYTSSSYRRAIHSAIEAANRKRAAEGLEPLPRWNPNQLRHLRAGEIQLACGIEAASAVLGHASLRTTEIYANRQLDLAVDATRRLG